MSKSDMILFHLKHMENQLKSSDFGHHDIQFKIVDRLLSRSEEILAEENSLINLIHVLLAEIRQIQEESAM